MLELRKITKSFGSVRANDSVDIAVRSGTIHAIVGENGAGKSTAMKIAYGFYRADSGEIAVDGNVQQIESANDAIRLGIGMVHQHFMLVETMTVAENIVLGLEPGSGLAVDFRTAAAEIARLSREFRMDVDPNALTGTLSVGQQQRVEILKALYRKARILILDEPTAVLAPAEIEGLFSTLREMREQQKTVVIITHKLSEVLAISDEVSVMRDGRVVGKVNTKETSAAELARLMVGRDVLLRVDKKKASPGDLVLGVDNLSIAGGSEQASLREVSLTVRAGEIVGIAGVEGNGQTELIEALAGLTRPSAGKVQYRGEDVSQLPARRRREIGIAHVPEDRHRRGLLLDFPVSDNSILGVHHKPPVTRGVMLDRPVIDGRAAEIIRDFDVRPPDATLPARALSGGNQQKLIIGREFRSLPKLLLISQPTRGVDIGAIQFIHQKLVELRDAGCAILLVSSELEEVTALADRLLIMHGGRIAGEVDPATTSAEQIGLLMTGGAAAEVPAGAAGREGTR